MKYFFEERDPAKYAELDDWHYAEDDFIWMRDITGQYGRFMLRMLEIYNAVLEEDADWFECPPTWQVMNAGRLHDDTVRKLNELEQQSKTD